MTRYADAKKVREWVKALPRANADATSQVTRVRTGVGVAPRDVAVAAMGPRLRKPRSPDLVALRGNGDYDVLEGVRDPRYEDPRTSGLPPFNPARFLPQRHVLLGVSFRF